MKASRFENKNRRFLHSIIYTEKFTTLNIVLIIPIIASNDCIPYLSFSSGKHYMHDVDDHHSATQAGRYFENFFRVCIASMGTSELQCIIDAIDFSIQGRGTEGERMRARNGVGAAELNGK